MLRDQGVREVTLLGQNVNSYADFGSEEARAAAATAAARAASGAGGGDEEAGPGAEAAAAAGQGDPFSVYAPGFRSVYKPARGGAVGFAELLDAVAGVDGEVRVRFTSPHPKDFNDDVLQVGSSGSRWTLRRATLLAMAGLGGGLWSCPAEGVRGGCCVLSAHGFPVS